MAAIHIEVGNKLDLVSIMRNPETSNEKVYKSQIVDVVDQQHYQISTPIDGYKILLLPVGGKYEATIYTGKSIYLCHVKVMDRYKVRNQYVMDIELLNTPKKFQRRAYYRLEYTRDMEFHLPGEETEEQLLEEEKKVEQEIEQDIIEETPILFDKGILLDLSGGGCRFVSREKILPGERLLLKIPLESDSKGVQTMVVMGKTLSSKVLENHGKSYEQRVEFVDIEKAQREEIIKFIFEQDRKNRKKGRIDEI
jgi:c-di-GMP-binding flagellar brake protein YcgR